MEVEDLALFRLSPFQEVLFILSKPGGPGEEHTSTTLDTNLEPTMAARVRSLRASSD